MATGQDGGTCKDTHYPVSMLSIHFRKPRFEPSGSRKGEAEITFRHNTITESHLRKHLRVKGSRFIIMFLLKTASPLLLHETTYIKDE